MKKFILSFVIMMAAWMGANAMSFERAQAEALYLTDKMAYELNLNDQQYNDAYEINLDYFLSIGSPSDLYGVYYNHRINDLRCILYDWQYSLLFAADYFLRPIVWRAGHWLFPIYGHYNRGFFYYSYPSVYISYHGGHSRYYHHGGFYGDRRPVWNGGMRGHDMHRPSPGMGGRVGGTRPGGAHPGGGRGYHIDLGGRGGGRGNTTPGGHNGGNNGGSMNPGGGHSGGNNGGSMNPGGGHSGGGNGGSMNPGGRGGQRGTGSSRGNSFDGSSSRVVGSRSVGSPGGSSYGNHSSSTHGGSFGSQSVGSSRSGGFGSHSGSTTRSGGFGGSSAGGSRSGGFGGGHSGGHSSGGSRGGRR